MFSCHAGGSKSIIWYLLPKTDEETATVNGVDIAWKAVLWQEQHRS